MFTRDLATFPYKKPALNDVLDRVTREYRNDRANIELSKAINKFERNKKIEILNDDLRKMIEE